MLSSDKILDRAAELKARGEPFVLATVVRCESPTSARPGAKAIVDQCGEIAGWVGGGCAQPAVLATAKKALADGQPRLIRVSPTKGAAVDEGIIDFGMTCHSGGTLDIFLEPFSARPALLILGASPVAEALSGLAHRTGFNVYAAGPAAAAGMFPDAAQVIEGLDLAALDCAELRFVVVATQGKRDEPALEAALATGASYIAFVASGRKAEKVKTYLRERGHDPGRVDAIVAPAGVAIGAITPEEIALSMLAGLVQARRSSGEQAPAAPSNVSRGNAALPSPATGSDNEEHAVDPICGMTVTVADAAFQSEYQGHKFYFCCAGCQHKFEKAPHTWAPEVHGAT